MSATKSPIAPGNGSGESRVVLVLISRAWKKPRDSYNTLHVCLSTRRRSIATCAINPMVDRALWPYQQRVRRGGVPEIDKASTSSRSQREQAASPCKPSGKHTILRIMITLRTLSTFPGVGWSGGGLVGQVLCYEYVRHLTESTLGPLTLS